jgi:hypothetical protein
MGSEIVWTQKKAIEVQQPENEGKKNCFTTACALFPNLEPVLWHK